MQIEFCNTLLTNKTHFLWYNVIVNKVPLKLFRARKSSKALKNALAYKLATNGLASYVTVLFRTDQPKAQAHLFARNGFINGKCQ